MASNEALDVYHGDYLVGRLYNAQPLRFEYEPPWQASPRAVSLSPSLPLTRRVHAGDDVVAYFENLLPEGDLRHHLEIRHHTSTLFGLLKAIGGDTASGFTLMPSGEALGVPRYRPLSWSALAEHLHNRERSPLLSQQSEGARISLAGAQDKLLLMLMEDGSPAIPVGSAPSSHILKPDIRRLSGIWASALNETFCMQLADTLGLEVAEASYQLDTRACLVRRYDRAPDDRGGLRKLHQLDLCQLSGSPSSIKYESDGGPGLARCRELLQQAGVPARDLQRLIGWFFFNLLIGNNDSHAKNLSLLQADEGPRLAPFYDLMSTTLYSGLSRHFAFQVTGENRPGSIEKSHLESLARSMRFQPRYFIKQGLQLAEQMPIALEATRASLEEVAQPGKEQILLERLHQRLTSNCRKLPAHWSASQM